ncbi:MAG: HAD hydrolase-like protein [Bacteroidia bacterium]
MNMHFDHLIFDLDGTISNPIEGLKNGFRYALQKMDHSGIDDSILDSFVGPPLQDSIRKHFFKEEEKIWETVRHFREYYGTTGLFENDVYEGIPEMLNELKAGGRTLFVATYKPQPYAERILEHFKLKHLFTLVHGVAVDRNDITKDIMIRRILDSREDHVHEKVVMIGDTAFDVLAGKQNGISTIGLTYGFGTAEDISNAGPAYTANSVGELRELLL